MLCIMAYAVSAQTYKNGVWYSLYDETEHTMNTQGDYETSVFAPTTGALTVQWKYMHIFIGVFKHVDTEALESANGGSTTRQLGTFAENTSNNSTTTEHFTTSTNINWIKYNRPDDHGLSGPTHKVIVYHQDLPLAKHILLASGEYGASSATHDFESVEALSASEPYKVNLRSFLTAGDITVTSSMPDIFRVGASDNTAGLTYAVGANACASANGTAATAGGASLGKIDNYGFDIYFTPQEVRTYEATITITDGVSTATVAVSGTGTKINQTISWEPETPILSSDTIVPATASSGLEVNYTFAPEGIVNYENGAFVVLSDGVVAITATQEGNDLYNAATPVVRTITIYPAEVHYTYERAMCEGDIYSDENFAQLSEAGLYCDTLPSVYGGDSIICLSLTVNPVYAFEETRFITIGTEETWHATDLSLLPEGDTTLVAAYTATTGCDSTYVLHLTVRPHITTYGNDTIHLCAGESYTYEGKTYRRSTTDSVLLAQPNQFGGDSIVELVVYVYPVVSMTLNNTIVEGEQETWQGFDLSELPVGDTTLVAVYTSVHGCDSTYVLHLTVEQNTQALEDTPMNGTVRKTVRNGQVLIRKGDAWYDLFGRKVE